MLFACGNVLHVHDLVDFVSEEAGNAGRNAALYINNNGEDKIPEEIKITLSPQNGVRYTVPSEIRIGHMAEEQLVRFRVGNVYKIVTSVHIWMENGSFPVKKRWQHPERWNRSN